MIFKYNKQIGFIYKNNESIDKILKDGEVVFERGFLRERTIATLPTTFGGVGKDLKDYKIYGNTYQNSPTGKNLFNKDDINVINGTIDVYYFKGELNGLNRTLYIQCLPNTTYTVQKRNDGDTNRFAIGSCSTEIALSGNTNLTTTNIDRNAENLTITTGPSDKYLLVMYYRTAETTLTEQQLRNSIQIEEGANATPYEQYTGGQPSPNPDYPQEIVSCGDRTKNSFSSKMELGTIGSQGNPASSENSIRTKDFIEVQPNTTYTISNNKNYYNYVYQYDDNYTFISSGNARNFITFTTESNTKFLKVRTNAGTIENDLTSLWQLEESSSATQYEPYGKYKIPVNVRSDNLFDLEWYFDNCYIHNCLKELVDNGIKISFTAGEDSYIGAVGKSGESVRPTIKNIAIKVKENTQYTFVASSFPKCYITYMDEDYNVLNDSYVKLNISYTKSSYTFTTPANCKYITFRMGIQDDGYTEWTFNDIQLIEGSTVPTTYIPYYNQTANIYLDEPLRKIGNYSDYLDYVNQKVVRNIKKIVLDGSENWIYSSSNAVFYSDCLTGKTANSFYYTTHFKYTDTQYSQWINGNCGSSGAATRCLLKNTSYTSVPDFKDWLSTNNVIVYYILTNPTEETITLPNIPTIDGNNTLNIETELTPSQVYIKYKSNS